MAWSSQTLVRSDVAHSTIFLGLDVHKESVTIAVLPSDAAVPTHVDKLSYDLKKLRRYLDRLGPAATLRACYEASSAGYVLQRERATWGIACTVIAPPLIATKPGVQRAHDTYDASQLARLFRAGEFTAVHVPTEADERVRDLVRCRSTFQREILKSRHYVLKFLARRGLDTHGAMVLATELADWRRFGSARELMAYFGLVPREHSSAERRRRGSITKAGNSYVRYDHRRSPWSPSRASWWGSCGR